MGTLHQLTDTDPEIRLGSIEVRLATSRADIDAAQALRYQVFYVEMGATPSPEMAAAQRDFDQFDAHCDHLLVIDHAGKTNNNVVGTYRLIRRAAAAQCGGFYSASEYELEPILQYPGELLELGRSCIAREYRTGPIMQILWKGLTAYVFKHNISMMFGCASLPGTDPAALQVPLSYLYHHHLAPPGLRPRAVESRYIDMQLLPREAFDPNAAFSALKMDPRSGSNSLPPLIKGYIRAGGFVGDGAVIDHQWNSVDVLIIVKTDLITSRYLKHYERSNKKDFVLPVE